MKAHFGFAPDILRRLGEELVPHADQGIVELVRNAYDADARTCTIELNRATSAGGQIVITDDGQGIPLDAIKSGWLVLGRSSKKRTERTLGNRIPAGDKGLGRLAGLRLGSTAVLRTRPIDEPGMQHKVVLDWSKFDGAVVVEDVAIEIKSEPTDESHGTTIELNGLRQHFTRQQVIRLARALVLLSDPFEHAHDFKPRLLAPEFDDLAKRVSQSYFDEVEYRITADLDATGRATARVLDWRGETRFSAGPAELTRRRDDRPFATSPAHFDLWAFSLNPAGFAQRAATLTEVAEWLRVVGGVHVYQHGLRVPSYGDAGGDWLDMNLRRARSPEFRPSTNTSVGRVVLDSEDGRLIQKTDRAGFVENEAFIELRDFLRDVLDWAAGEQLRVADRKRREERRRAEQGARSAEQDAETVKDSLEESADPKAKAAFQRYKRAMQKQMAALREDVLLYRTLGTVGTTSSAFAHESVKPAARIEQGVRLVRSRGTKAFGPPFTESVGASLEAIEKASIALSRWSKLPLSLLRRDKRRSRRVDVREAIAEVAQLLKPFVVEANIELEVSVPEVEVPVFAAPAAVEAIVANLLVNSITAVVDSPTKPRRIRVLLTAEADSTYATLAVADTGGGLQAISSEDVWLPGRTTREQGTGLGLTIVKDSAVDLGGSVNVDGASDLGGAEFLISLPLLGAVAP